MKKITMLLIICVLFSFSITGCVFNKNDSWKNAYADVLRSLPVLSDNNTYTFALRDLDNNKMPEIIILKHNGNALNAVYTVYSYDDNIYKAGDYSNPAGQCVTGLCFSNNSMFPGLFECWEAEGVEHYGYLSVTKGKLIYEDLWYMNRTSDPPHQVEISNNKQLINESIATFPPYEYSDNLLEMYPVNDENIDEKIKNFIS